MLNTNGMKHTYFNLNAINFIACFNTVDLLLGKGVVLCLGICIYNVLYYMTIRPHLFTIQCKN